MKNHDLLSLMSTACAGGGRKPREVPGAGTSQTFILKITGSPTQPVTSCVGSKSYVSVWYEPSAHVRTSVSRSAAAASPAGTGSTMFEKSTNMLTKPTASHIPSSAHMISSATSKISTTLSSVDGRSRKTRPFPTTMKSPAVALRGPSSVSTSKEPRW